MRTGSGKPLLLVHGISNLHNWDLVVPALARERTVVAIDLPGFGQSPPVAGEVSVASLTDAVEDFIAEQDLGDVDVVGSSMGARMVLEMARRGHAGDVVALDPGGFWSDRQVKIFGATVRPSIALVKRIQPLLPALTSSAVGRTALLLQFRPNRGGSPRIWCWENCATSTALRAWTTLCERWCKGPNSKAHRQVR